MKKLLFIVLMIPLLASASNWVKVGKSTDGDIFFIDTQSMNRSGDSVTFWVKVNYPTRTESGNFSSKTNKTINCRTREIIFRHFMFYDDLNNNGKLTNSFAALASDVWQPIAPDTMNESAMKFVCKQ
jgi:hypothetical protein